MLLIRKTACPPIQETVCPTLRAMNRLCAGQFYDQEFVDCDTLVVSLYSPSPYYDTSGGITPQNAPREEITVWHSLGDVAGTVSVLCVASLGHQATFKIYYGGELIDTVTPSGSDVTVPITYDPRTSTQVKVVVTGVPDGFVIDTGRHINVYGSWSYRISCPVP